MNSLKGSVPDCIMSAEGLLKVVVIGDAGSGKTTLIRAFARGKTSVSSVADTPEVVGSEGAQPTVSPYFLHISRKAHNRNWLLEAWDTCGLHNLRGLGVPFYRDADGAVFVFDLSTKDGYRGADEWFQFFFDAVRPYSSDTFPIIVVGCKADKADSIHPDAEVVLSKWRRDGVASVKPKSAGAKEQKVRFAPYFEVCASDVTHNAYQNIDVAFEKIVSITAKRALRGMNSSSLVSACLGRNESGAPMGVAHAYDDGLIYNSKIKRLRCYYYNVVFIMM